MTKALVTTAPSRLSDQQLKRMLRVNHAGEYGAVRIYKGQQAVLASSSIGHDLEHMAEQEQEHLTRFEKLIAENHVRPTVLSPVWHIAGFALGYGSALMGKKAAMACTVAVEEVIDEHYTEQLKILRANQAPQDLINVIEKCHAEELEHRDLAVEKEARSFRGFKPLSRFIKGASKTAIWLSERL